MIIYNVTVKVDSSIAKEWLQWMQEIHIPEVIATGYFNNYKILHLLEIDEAEGPTYAIQYEAENLDDYNKYISECATLLRQKTFDKWGGKFVAFRTLMEVVH
ncbi:MAG: DUF4286 family protein [Flavisolibacter sp.]|nr:DUF4286 family protein [Flavisolibacter sp.]